MDERKEFASKNSPMAFEQIGDNTYKSYCDITDSYIILEFSETQPPELDESIARILLSDLLDN